MPLDDFAVHPVIRLRAVEVAPHEGHWKTGQQSSKLPKGMVVLFESETGTPITLFNLFLRAVTVGRPFHKWKETQESYADDLANWYAFLAFRNVVPALAGFADLEDYAAVLTQEVSSNTGFSFSDSTRRRRLGTVLTCYDWLTSNGFLAQNPLEREKSSIRTAEPKNLSELLPPQPRPDEHVTVVPLPILKQILCRLGPKVEERVPYGPSTRDRLAVETAAATAMRVDEIANIDVHRILDMEKLIDPSDPKQIFNLRLSKTKGRRRARDVVIAKKLLLKLLLYIKNERAEICRRFLELNGGRRDPSSKLFLNLISASHRDLGNPASADTLSRKFSEAAIAEGHVRRHVRAKIGLDGVPLRDGSGALIEEVTFSAANTIHDLRHTYVVVGYKILTAKGIKNPWKQLSLVLGHKEVQTTIDIYGRHVHIDEAELTDILDEMLYDRDSWSGSFR
jgi:integrase